jgi:hypothetical protein
MAMTSRRVLAVLFALACAPCGGLACQKNPEAKPETTSTSNSAPETKKPFREMTVDELEAKLAANDGKTFVYDANPREVFDKMRVPGATWVPFDGVTAAVLPKDKQATVVFYCANTY